MDGLQPTAADRVWAAALRRAIERMGLPIPGDPEALTGRELLHTAWVQGGWIAMPLLGQTLPAALPVPLHLGMPADAVLAAATQALNALQGSAATPVPGTHHGQAAWLRSSTAADATVRAQDDLLGLGFAAACMVQAGWADVQVWLAGVPVYPWADEAALAALVAADGTGQGLITWAAQPADWAGSDLPGACEGPGKKVRAA